jgi:hypothetical protein
MSKCRFPVRRLSGSKKNSELLHANFRQPLMMQEHSQMHILARGKLYSLKENTPNHCSQNRKVHASPWGPDDPLVIVTSDV